ncbi:magnesium transporter MgtC [Desulfuromonas versatilis]|uniref:Magnesium transporter MgtC n=1 Tax=Desulfuromonas versatilis TaxID=2802975 RepID=A0ABM8HN36_9BACT|nr:MgtC/SapB family protein [Desulfuromonas versatilis]BCR04019.1 magnesium transporter MgtC [Desulfuromonas versatilis]
MFLANTLHGSYEAMVLVKLLLSALAGGIIGVEREKHGRPAGLRTHLLVAVAACLMMVVSEAFYLKYGDLAGTGVVRLDPSRAAAQIISGIGFLGAGVILKEGVNIRGLTTAASLWMAAGLGMAFGMGLVAPAAMAAAVALASLIWLKKLEPVIQKDRYLFLTVIAENRGGIYEELEGLLTERNLRLNNIESSLDLAKCEVCYEFIITNHHRRIGRELTQAISTLAGVRRINFK